MRRPKSKTKLYLLVGLLLVFLLTACQDTPDPSDEMLLSESTILKAFENRGISTDEITADLEIEIYPTIWEALEEYQYFQSFGEAFYYREDENRFRFWVKNAIITLHFNETDLEDYIQILNPMREVVFEDLNPMEMMMLEGENGAWRAMVPIQYYAYAFEDEEGEEQLASFYRLEVELSYDGSTENTFHELEVMYEMDRQDGYGRSAIEAVIGPAEEVLTDDGMIRLYDGFNRSGPEHPLHFDHTIYLTDFYGQEIQIELQSVDR